MADFNAAWMDVTHAFYGEPGALFTYENVDNLWSYVGHFLRPFYVYAYAFGELFTQSLFARRDDFGKDVRTALSRICCAPAAARVRSN